MFKKISRKDSSDSSEEEVPRYHPDALDISMLADELQNSEEKRSQIVRYFNERIEIYGEPSMNQASTSKTCLVMSCDLPVHRANLCHIHHKIGRSISNQLDGRLCCEENCQNKIWSNKKCEFHNNNNSVAPVHEIILEEVQDLSEQAASFVQEEAARYPRDKFYIGISQDVDTKIYQHTRASGQTRNLTEKYILVEGVDNIIVLNALEHIILDLTDRIKKIG